VTALLDRASLERLGGLTSAERELLEALGDCWNAFCRLPPGHPSEAPEFQHAVHALQHLVMARVTARLYPDVFRGPKEEQRV
jgi:hypothetical protein